MINIQFWHGMRKYISHPKRIKLTRKAEIMIRYE